MRRSWLTTLALLGAWAVAEAGDTYREFYESKKQTATKEAFGRAEKRIAGARIGMTQREFFAVMEMTVLARRGKVHDVYVDGYLWKPSVEATRPPGTKILVFGYVEDGCEVGKFEVLFRNDLVSDIRSIGRAPQPGEMDKQETGEAVAVDHPPADGSPAG